jgi:hypothetical protein
MSKQSEAKAKQNYQDKPLSRRCRECANLDKKMEKYPEGHRKHSFGWKREVLTCKIGGFKVTANAVCDLFEKN